MGSELRVTQCYHNLIVKNNTTLLYYRKCAVTMAGQPDEEEMFELRSAIQRLTDVITELVDEIFELRNQL